LISSSCLNSPCRIVVLFGLFLNNVAVIIGAMIISPLLEPIYAGTVFLADGGVRKFLEHLMVVLFLVLVLIIVSAFITWVLSFFVPLAITPEISLRLQQQDISAILAIVLGITAIFAHKRGFIASVIGIGIAVALVPPAVVTGIAITLLPTRIIDALFPNAEQHIRTLCRDADRHSVLGIGPRSEVKKKLTRKNVYLMLACVAGLLIIIWYSLSIQHHSM
jgi:uncharacterized hydrophobic protein (TIGR00271 family)